MGLPFTYIEYWPVLLALVGAFGFAAGTVLFSAILTRRHPNPAKQESYECGMRPLAPARIQISVKFYLIALLFLLFDMETMFVLAWAVTFREPGFQLFSLIEMVVFIGILLVGYLYAWRKGALEWN